MWLKRKKYFRLMIMCSVICVISYIYTSNNIKKQLFEHDFEDDYNILNGENSEERVIYSKSNVSNLKKYTDNIKELDSVFLNVTSKCKGILFPSNLATKESWRATDEQNTAYVFNAHLDKIKFRIVIVGIKEGGASKYVCQFWNRTFGSPNVKMEEKPTKVVILSELHHRRYRAVLFQCMFSPSGNLPTHISIVTGSCKTPMNMFDIQTSRKPNAIKRRFTVCLTPLHFRYNNDYEIIEWIELNKILGAEYFIVYNYSSDINVKHVLEYYSQRGLADVVQWNLPIGVEAWQRENKPVDIYYFGQVAALHDCLYRNKRVSEFIVHLDLDEFIIPHGENVIKWSDILTQLGHDSVYLFRNTFFKREWNNAGIEIQNKSLVDKLRLVTLQKLQHETEIWPPPLRSKYFANADKVSQVTIHEVSWVRSVLVPVEIGLVHKYRDSEKTWGDFPHAKVLDNTVPRKYGQYLIRNVQKVWSDLNTVT